MLPVFGKATSFNLSWVPTPPHLKSRNYQSAPGFIILNSLHPYVVPYDHPKTFTSWVVSTLATHMQVTLEHYPPPPVLQVYAHVCLTTTTSIHTVWWFKNPKQPPGMYKTPVNHGICLHISTSWWFQPIWKHITVVNLDSFPQKIWMKNNKTFELPPPIVYHPQPAFHGEGFLHSIGSYPEDPCMVYLPTFTIKINQM